MIVILFIIFVVSCFGIDFCIDGDSIVVPCWHQFRNFAASMCAFILDHLWTPYDKVDARIGVVIVA